jgi:hypothetical protein
MDVVPGGVNQWWFPWPRKAHVAGGFARVVCWVGATADWDSGIRRFWNVSMLLFSLGCWQCARRLAEPSWPPNAGVTERLARASTGRTWCCKQADLELAGEAKGELAKKC